MHHCLPTNQINLTIIGSLFGAACALVTIPASFLICGCLDVLCYGDRMRDVMPCRNGNFESPRWKISKPEHHNKWHRPKSGAAACTETAAAMSETAAAKSETAAAKSETAAWTETDKPQVAAAAKTEEAATTGSVTPTERAMPPKVFVAASAKDPPYVGASPHAVASPVDDSLSPVSSARRKPEVIAI
ncbi:putative transmembrane protein [Gregarina niphandrodes]|uniref:Transmembrane protein n=1 Tax=Gregarina niphandrodes TaxID=110365 RepID=A0A023BAR9_GRENI|nr:putative transmembrane protein [Gregarina niphandrodes]EZG78547.1 putative transmembrane protein [Gregarina niphandrodes]|eukprot:XP_011129253.1 putative transmembrane protein [Gregarina niphandrodes]